MNTQPKFSDLIQEILESNDGKEGLSMKEIVKKIQEKNPDIKKSTIQRELNLCAQKGLLAKTSKFSIPKRANAKAEVVANSQKEDEVQEILPLMIGAAGSQNLERQEELKMNDARVEMVEVLEKTVSEVS